MTIETELLQFKNADGLFLVQDAEIWARKNPESALHKRLEWDDQIAGREYRYWQVRQLIALHIKTEEGDRRLVSLSIDRVKPGGGYRELNDVLNVQSLYAIMLQDCLNELERVRKKYERVREMEPVWQAVEQVRRRRRRKPSDEETRQAV